MYVSTTRSPNCVKMELVYEVSTSLLEAPPLFRQNLFGLYSRDAVFFCSMCILRRPTCQLCKYVVHQVAHSQTKALCWRDNWRLVGEFVWKRCAVFTTQPFPWFVQTKNSQEFLPNHVAVYSWSAQLLRGRHRTDRSVPTLITFHGFSVEIQSPTGVYCPPWPKVPCLLQTWFLIGTMCRLIFPSMARKTKVTMFRPCSFTRGWPRRQCRCSSF